MNSRKKNIFDGHNLDDALTSGCVKDEDYERLYKEHGIEDYADESWWNEVVDLILLESDLTSDEANELRRSLNFHRKKLNLFGNGKKLSNLEVLLSYFEVVCLGTSIRQRVIDVGGKISVDSNSGSDIRVGRMRAAVTKFLWLNGELDA